jgi:hypothetical protein
MGKTGNKLGHIGQAFSDFMGLQLEGHRAIVMNSAKRFKQSFEVDHPFTGWEMQVIRVRTPSAVIVQVNVFDSLREFLDEAQASVLLAKQLSVAQIKGHHEGRDLMEGGFQIPRLFAQVLDADRDLVFISLFHHSLENIPF